MELVGSMLLDPMLIGRVAEEPPFDKGGLLHISSNVVQIVEDLWIFVTMQKVLT
jgi:hypothetical protein